MVGTTEELNFTFYFILINLNFSLNFNSHTWLRVGESSEDRDCISCISSLLPNLGLSHSCLIKEKERIQEDPNNPMYVVVPSSAVDVTSNLVPLVPLLLLTADFILSLRGRNGEMQLRGPNKLQGIVKMKSTGNIRRLK